MAKSLRSKRKRKVRAEKRIVNAKKELVKLKTIAARLHNTNDNGPVTRETLEQANLPDVEVAKETPMMVDDGAEGGAGKKAGKLVINNQWMNQRKIKSIKNKIKKHNKKKSRRGGSGGLSSRKVKSSLKK